MERISTREGRPPAEGGGLPQNTAFAECHPMVDVHPAPSLGQVSPLESEVFTQQRHLMVASQVDVNRSPTSLLGQLRNSQLLEKPR
jgi:hypothetical protein